MRINQILTAIFSIMLVMIGVDKFFGFLQPACTLQSDINPIVWKAIGIIQISFGILAWNIKWRKSVAWMILGLMIYFSIRHLTAGTNDIGGAVFMGVLAIMIIWNPFSKTNK